MTPKKTKKKIRVDQLLLDKGFCKNLKEASAFIYEGKVYTDNRKILNPSETLFFTDFLGIKGKTKNFVSRAGEKLSSALTSLNLTSVFKDKIILDIGSSTGGFTDCALQHGAKTVIALDVGTNQLAWALRQNKNVISIEKTHIKDFISSNHPEADFIVADISFNSLAKLAPHISKASPKENLQLLLLVKPQFELPKELVPEKGIVTNKEHQKLAIQKVQDAFESFGFQRLGQADSGLKGKTGNQETFLHFTRKSITL